MKKLSVKTILILSVLMFVLFLIIDFLNIPTLIGVDTATVNWDLFLGLLNFWVVVLLYIITYKKIDKRNLERENNKEDLANLLISSCYNECREYLKLFTPETIEKYILPKVDFNSTSNKVVTNLQEAPFANENVIMDLAKDGQIKKEQIEGYFKVKDKYRVFVNSRITFFDAPHIYDPVLKELAEAINEEQNNLAKEKSNNL